MAKTLANLTGTNTTSGFMEHPSGALEQWGLVSVAGGQTLTVPLQKQYATTGFNVIVSVGVPISAGGWTVGGAVVDASSIKIQNTDSLTHGIFWRTIGQIKP